MFLLCIDTSLLIEDNSLKGISFTSEVKLKALSQSLLVKLLDESEKNISKSEQLLKWPLMKDLKRVFFWKRLGVSAILVKALSLLPAFLQMWFTYLSNLSSLSIITPEILFTEVFFSFYIRRYTKFLYTKISSTDRFDPKHTKLHFPGFRAM